MGNSLSFSGDSAAYLESLYQAYLADPKSVSAEWQGYFESLTDASSPALAEEAVVESGAAKNLATQQAKVDALICGYRRYGHFNARVNPLSNSAREIAELDLEFYQLTQKERSAFFLTGGVLPRESASLEEICFALKAIYLGSIGYEYMHITHREERLWLQERIEASLLWKPGTDQQKRILKLLIAADGIEKFLATKYVGQKRFSLEGGDSLIPLLHTVAQAASDLSVKEIVIGMAHRGRINVLVNVDRKSVV